MRAYIELTATGIDIRLGRLCATLNTRHLRLVPACRIWII